MTDRTRTAIEKRGRALWPGPEPWPHQVEALENCMELLQGPPGRGLVQAPTGCGKSRLMRAITYGLLQQRRRVVICVPTQEILKQFADAFRRETKVPFYIEQAEKEAPRHALITLASQQTIWRRLNKYDPQVVVLFDECHHSNEEAERNLSTVLQFRQVLGFSASPWTQLCQEVYQGRLLHRYGLARAIQEGHLCSVGLQSLPEWIPAPKGHELYYCRSNEEARKLAQQCPGSAYLGHEVAERGRIVEDFLRGRIRRIYCNRMLTEGFDCAEVSTIWIDKVSDSDVLTYQMVGRGLRKKKQGTGLVVYCKDPWRVASALVRAA